MSNVPDDILFPILTGLPVKSLLRFQSVSKPWLISDNKFKITHCDESKALGRVTSIFVITFKYLTKVYVVCSANKNFWTLKKTLLILEKSLEDRRFESVSEGISTKDCVYWSLDNIGYVYWSLDPIKLLQYMLPAIPDFVGENDLFRLSTLKDCLSLYGGKINGTGYR